jgi:sortase A
LGIAFLLAALGLLCYNVWESQSALQASRDVLIQIQTRQEQLPEPAEGDPYVEHMDAFDQTAKEMTVREIDGHEYIGYLSIPVLEKELPVMSQWAYEWLEIAPCRQYGSTKTDDLVIAAHNYASHFGRLSQLRSADLLTFTDMDGEIVLYAVEVVDVLDPDAVDTVKNSDFDLVLYTCTYGGSSRIAVFCNRATIE